MKKIALLLAFLVVISILSLPASANLTSAVAISMSGSITSSMALHVVGNKVENINNNPIQLRGINYQSFILSTYGRSQLFNFSQWQADGFKMIRLTLTAEYIVQDTGGYIQNLQSFIMTAASYGMYVELCLWRSNSSIMGASDGPFPNSIFPTQLSFIQFWNTTMFQDFGSYPNVLFQFWNEPYQVNELVWYQTSGMIITSLRAEGYTNPLIVMYSFGDYAHAFNGGNSTGGYYGYFPEDFNFNSSSSYPDSNIIYASDWYGNMGYNDPNGLGTFSYAYNLTDLFTQCQADGLFYDMQRYPIYITEIGQDHYQNSTYDNQFFTNALSILNSGAIGYTAWEWEQGAGTEWVLSNPDGSPNIYGVILINAIDNNTKVTLPSNPSAPSINARYSWENNPDCLFYDDFENGELLPSSYSILIFGSSGATHTVTSSNPIDGNYSGSFSCGGPNGWSFAAAVAGDSNVNATFQMQVTTTPTNGFFETVALSNDSVGDSFTSLAIENSAGVYHMGLVTWENGVQVSAVFDTTSDNVANVHNYILQRDYTDGVERVWQDGNLKVSASIPLDCPTNSILIGISTNDASTIAGIIIDDVNVTSFYPYLIYNTVG